MPESIDDLARVECFTVGRYNERGEVMAEVCWDESATDLRQLDVARIVQIKPTSSSHRVYSVEAYVGQKHLCCCARGASGDFWRAVPELLSPCR